MIGNMIQKVRNEKGMTKTELARLTGINIGHLTHIEKSERNPSLKALKNICRALNVPHQQIVYTYDKALKETQEPYIVHISHNRVPAIKLNDFIDCPPSMPSSNLAVKMPDDSLSPTFQKWDYLFVELNTILEDGECGVFKLNDKILIRNFSTQSKSIVLTATNKDFKDIAVKDSDQFYIIGKVLGK